MASTNLMYYQLYFSLRNLTFLALLLVIVPSHVYAQTAADQVQRAETDMDLQSAVENLANIQQSIEIKRNTARKLI